MDIDVVGLYSLLENLQLMLLTFLEAIRSFLPEIS